MLSSEHHRQRGVPVVIVDSGGNPGPCLRIGGAMPQGAQLELQDGVAGFDDPLAGAKPGWPIDWRMPSRPRAG